MPLLQLGVAMLVDIKALSSIICGTHAYTVAPLAFYVLSLLEG